MSDKVHVFVGISPSFPQALSQATNAANAFLATHQWKGGDGRSIYVVVPHTHFDGTLYTYILHLIGPAEETT